MFSVPKEDFAEKSRLQIQFSFDWQNEDGAFAAQDEYENVVTFSESDLSKGALEE